MDPVTLATAAVEALIPYFGKGLVTGGQAVAEELGKKSSEIGESILKVLWARWKNKPQAQDKLAKFASAPTDARDPLTMEVVADVASDKHFAESLERLLQKHDSPDVFVRITARNAEEITGAKIREMLRGKLTADIDVGEARKITGFEIDKVG